MTLHYIDVQVPMVWIDGREVVYSSILLQRFLVLSDGSQTTLILQHTPSSSTPQNSIALLTDSAFRRSSPRMCSCGSRTIAPRSSVRNWNNSRPSAAEAVVLRAVVDSLRPSCQELRDLLICEWLTAVIRKHPRIAPPPRQGDQDDGIEWADLLMLLLTQDNRARVLTLVVFL